MFLDSESDDKVESLWMLNVRSLKIEYYDGSSWVSEWDYEESGMLPEAVRVELELADSSATTYSFSTMAHIHVNTSPGETSQSYSEEQKTS